MPVGRSRDGTDHRHPIKRRRYRHNAECPVGGRREPRNRASGRPSLASIYHTPLSSKRADAPVGAAAHTRGISLGREGDGPNRSEHNATERLLTGAVARWSQPVLGRLLQMSTARHRPSRLDTTVRAPNAPVGDRTGYHGAFDSAAAAQRNRAATPWCSAKTRSGPTAPTQGPLSRAVGSRLRPFGGSSCSTASVRQVRCANLTPSA